MLRLLSLLLLIVFSSCGGAFSEVRKDRDIVLHLKNGVWSPVLVSSLKYRDKDPEMLNFYRRFDNGELSISEADAIARLFVAGGTCHLSGAAIPPLEPEEAFDFYLNDVLWEVRQLVMGNPELRSMERADLLETAKHRAELAPGAWILRARAEAYSPDLSIPLSFVDELLSHLDQANSSNLGPIR